MPFGILFFGCSDEKCLFELHDVGSAFDFLVDNNAEEHQLLFSGDADVGKHLAVCQVGFHLQFVHHLLINVVAAKEVEVDAGFSLGLDSAHISEVGATDGGTITHSSQSALGDAAAHGESHHNGSKQKENSFLHCFVPDTCRAQLLVNKMII